MSSRTWTQWKQDIVEIIRDDYRELFPCVQQDDLDWDAWKPLYDAGHAPSIAVGHAFAWMKELSSHAA